VPRLGETSTTPFAWQTRCHGPPFPAADVLSKTEHILKWMEDRWPGEALGTQAAQLLLAGIADFADLCHVQMPMFGSIAMFSHFILGLPFGAM
jgi:hypothetical protein